MKKILIIQGGGRANGNTWFRKLKKRIVLYLHRHYISGRYRQKLKHLLNAFTASQKRIQILRLDDMKSIR